MPHRCRWFGVLSAFSLALFALTAAARLRMTFAVDRVWYVHWDDAARCANGYYWSPSQDGWLRFQKTRIRALPTDDASVIRRNGGHHFGHDHYPNTGRPPHDALWPVIAWGHYTQPISGAFNGGLEVWGFGVRAWAALIATLVMPALWLRRRFRAARPVPGACAQCGYDLRATPDRQGPLLGRCPECGAAADAARV